MGKEYRISKKREIVLEIFFEDKDRKESRTII
jgi:hypothetical protein